MTANIDNNNIHKQDPVRTSNGDHSLQGDSKTTEYKTYHYRWVVLVLFFLIGHNNSVLFSCFSYFSEPLNVLYGVPTNLNTILFAMMCYALYFVGERFSSLCILSSPPPLPLYNTKGTPLSFPFLSFLTRYPLLCLVYLPLPIPDSS